MTDERRQDLVVAAFAVSVAVHVAAMFFMRPQVMTHVTGAGARERARAPMRVRDAPPPQEAVSLDEVRDVKPLRDEPVADAGEALPRTDAFSFAPEALEVPPPEVPSAPSVPFMTVENAPLLSEPIHVEPGKSSFTTPLAKDAPLMFAPRAAPPAPAPAEPEPVSAPPPVAPVAVPEISLAPEKAPASDPAPVAKTEPKPFIPAAEVMKEVDEKVVEEEKAAVRDLLDVRHADELAQSVDVSATCETGSDGWKYFLAAVAPRMDLEIVPKDVVILIDASGSIANDRLRSCREAARSILRSCMNSGDRFNLVAFRDKFDYAFQTWQECDKPAYEAAGRWMDKLAAHGRTDVFATISSVLKLPRDPKRPLVALVVTDGDANAGVSATSQILSRFTSLNDGLVSVYMYGVKGTANRELIDVLTHGNRGESFIYDGDRKQAGSGIAPLVAKFRDPVLTDLRIVFTAASRAEAYPERLRNLYKGETVEVFGRVPADVDEVSFSLKGLNGDKAFEGFFRIDVSQPSPAQGGGRTGVLERVWRTEKKIAMKLQPRKK